MMPAPCSADLRRQLNWFVHILQNSVPEASFFLGVCERTMERYISKFLVNGHVKRGQLAVHTAVSVQRNTKNSLFLYAKYGNHTSFRSCNFHSPFSPTTFFEIGVFTPGEQRNTEYLKLKYSPSTPEWKTRKASVSSVSPLSEQTFINSFDKTTSCFIKVIRLSLSLC